MAVWCCSHLNKDILILFAHCHQDSQTHSLLNLLHPPIFTTHNLLISTVKQPCIHSSENFQLCRENTSGHESELRLYPLLNNNDKFILPPEKIFRCKQKGMEEGNDWSSVLAQQTQIQQSQGFLGALAFGGKKMYIAINQQVEKLSITWAGSSWPFIHGPKLNQPGGLDIKVISFPGRTSCSHTRNLCKQHPFSGKARLSWS